MVTLLVYFYIMDCAFKVSVYLKDVSFLLFCCQLATTVVLNDMLLCRRNITTITSAIV